MSKYVALGLAPREMTAWKENRAFPTGPDSALRGLVQGGLSVDTAPLRPRELPLITALHSARVDAPVTLGLSHSTKVSCLI